WSMGILSRELRTLYDALSSGRPAQLPALPIQYADFAVWQRGQLAGATLEAHLAYWRDQLAGTPPVLALPSDRERPAAWTARGASQGFTVERSVLDALLALARSEGATLFMVLLAAFHALLHRYTGQTAIVVGSPIANRTRPELEGLIGFFVNTLALRSNVDGALPFRALLRQIRETCLGAYAHQDLPFEKLVADLQPDRSLNHNPIFQVGFSFENTPTSPRPSDPIDGKVTESTAKFDLLLVMAETATGVGGVWEYSTDLFEHERIRRMSGHLVTLLSSLAAAPDAPVGELALLGPDERQRLAASPSLPAGAGEAALWQLARRQICHAGMWFSAQDVEHALSNHPAIRDAHACKRATPTAHELVAFVVAREPSAGLDGDLGAVQRYLADQLPAPMIPARLIVVDELPRGPDGEVLADALLEPTGAPAAAPLAGDHVAPRTALESALADLWMEILALDRLGVTDNFFELGAHSLLVTQLTARIQDLFDIEVSLRTIFEAPTVAQLADAMLAGIGDAERARLDSIAELLGEVSRLDDREVDERLQGGPR
ncbi:MAG TPA: condensation domain-containing protein, partial [Kofleriaceae bacterium]|nr:condensation domain-containing protein [Kofleriaceae bacterium]